MARPSKLDGEVANMIVIVLQRGLPIEDACEATGIDPSTFHRWMRAGKKHAAAQSRGETLTAEAKGFCEFYHASRKARAVGKISLVDVLNNIALDRKHPKQAAAIMWLLERMHPKQFGRKLIRIENTGPEGGPIEMTGGHPVVKIIMNGSLEPEKEVDLSQEADQTADDA